ncbi:MAG: hypothetical protein PHW07_06535 [Sulfurospirillaceae bacterium]|nr:hypothetical protein [Sulfurospirillaceae bacterium]
MSIKSLLLCLAIMMCSGCATYDVGKVVYVGGKAVVKENADLIDTDTMQELKRVDRVATTVDSVRTEVKKSVAGESEANTPLVSGVGGK